MKEKGNEEKEKIERKKKKIANIKEEGREVKII